MNSSATSDKTSKPTRRLVFEQALLHIFREIFMTPRGWCLICICVAAIVIWPARHHIISDGLSYMDMASEASTGHLSALGNPYWSTAYPALIGAALYLLRPSAANEVPVLQLVNFIISIFAFWAFSLFFRFWSSSIPEYQRASSRDKGLFTLFAFASFLWFAFYSIGITLTTPDVLVAAMVFLAAAMGFRASRADAGWEQFMELGAVLGFGIYVKAALFPLAFVFIALLIFSLARNSKVPRMRLLAYLAVTTATCILVATPIIAFMSKIDGGFTTGDSGKLNYFWNVDGIAPNLVGWTGGTAAKYGTPTHPPRILVSNPMVLEFAKPVTGTYPLWRSPGYWFAGAKPVFDLRKQIQIIGESLSIFKMIGVHAIGFIAGAVLLFVLGMSKNKSADPWRLSLWMVAWPLAASAMYALVRTQPRYVLAFLLLLTLEVYRALVFRVERRIAIGVCAIALLVAMAPVALNVAGAAEATVGQVRHPVDEDYVTAAINLQHLGLKPGDKLGVVGFALNCYYARYDRLRVVSQIMRPDDYWRLNPADARRVDDRIASIGVKALVAMNRPASNQGSGWTEVGPYAGGTLSVLLLPSPDNPSHLQHPALHPVLLGKSGKPARVDAGG
jgi:hypothetical protein